MSWVDSWNDRMLVDHDSYLFNPPDGKEEQEEDEHEYMEREDE